VQLNLTKKINLTKLKKTELKTKLKQVKLN